MEERGEGLISEEYLIRHCSPTLAGLKTASLFTCPYGQKETLLDSLRQMNRRLRDKGLYLVPLRFSEKKALIYLYRPRKLTADMCDDLARHLLQEKGYDPKNCHRCVARLRQRLREQGEFPHEIGLFLGYPAEDVQGFMEQGPDNCKCTGCWKVYSDVDGARKKFAQYKKCTRVYCDQWEKGKDIERLTVAG